MQQDQSAARHACASIGWIDTPVSEGIVGPVVRIEGWALAAAGVRGVEMRIGTQRFVARHGLPRSDVAAVHPDYPDAAKAGFAFTADLSSWPAPRGVDRRSIVVVAIDRNDRESVLGTRSLVEPAAHARWRFLAADAAPPFYLLPALSGIARGGAFGLDTAYTAYASPTTRIGTRVPILYLRTTHGASGDHAFDAHFDTRRSNGARLVADDALAPLLAHAAAHRLPVLVTLNGGIWSDAAGTCPAWDLTDRLEEDVANCQWNECDQVMPDDYLTHLPGSQHAPELARALTLNVYARAVRAYKRRNLQQAAAHLVTFMREHDDLFVGVNLDPDVYVNPFFAGKQWYDYNPGTLRQFRYWLAGSGPYAGRCEDEVPVLAGYRRAHPLSLDDASALARRRFARWEDVDPPRAFRRDGETPHWKDPWVAEWEVFRRHLVTLHYDELAQWVAACGIPADRIWSSQGLDAPTDLDAPPEGFMPLALSPWSPPRNFDAGGVSIEGSKPRAGHLGAIVYGDAATNAMPMENGKRLYATLARIDPDFGIVEFNTADLRHRERHPTYADAYRALRDAWNAGARFVSPMAWNGSNGAHASDPGYVSFTAWRNTPLEDAARDFLLARSGLPRGSRLWTFGTPTHADDDGWSCLAGALHSRPGALELVADAGGTMTLVSPPDLDLRHARRIVLGLDETIDGTIEVAALHADERPWQVLARARLCATDRTAAGFVMGCQAGGAARLRLTFAVAPRARMALARVALLAT